MLEGGPVTSCHVTYGRCHASDVLKIALFFFKLFNREIQRIET